MFAFVFCAILAVQANANAINQVQDAFTRSAEQLGGFGTFATAPAAAAAAAPAAAVPAGDSPPQAAAAAPPHALELKPAPRAARGAPPGAAAAAVQSAVAAPDAVENEQLQALADEWRLTAAQARAAGQPGLEGARAGRSRALRGPMHEAWCASQAGALPALPHPAPPRPAAPPAVRTCRQDPRLRQRLQPRGARACARAGGPPRAAAAGTGRAPQRPGEGGGPHATRGGAPLAERGRAAFGVLARPESCRPCMD